jgi:hypothetical protein
MLFLRTILEWPAHRRACVQRIICLPSMTDFRQPRSIVYAWNSYIATSFRDLHLKIGLEDRAQLYRYKTMLTTKTLPRPGNPANRPSLNEMALRLVLNTLGSIICLSPNTELVIISFEPCYGTPCALPGLSENYNDHIIFDHINRCVLREGRQGCYDDLDFFTFRLCSFASRTSLKLANMPAKVKFQFVAGLTHY